MLKHCYTNSDYVFENILSTTLGVIYMHKIVRSIYIYRNYNIFLVNREDIIKFLFRSS